MVSEEPIEGVGARAAVRLLWAHQEALSLAAIRARFGFGEVRDAWDCDSIRDAVRTVTREPDLDHIAYLRRRVQSGRDGRQRESPRPDDGVSESRSPRRVRLHLWRGGLRHHRLVEPQAGEELADRSVAVFEGFRIRNHCHRHEPIVSLKEIEHRDEAAVARAYLCKALREGQPIAQINLPWGRGLADQGLACNQSRPSVLQFLRQ